MDYAKIINEMQTNIYQLQRQLEQLKAFDFEFTKDVYFTRQQAADFIGKSLRQLDRDCKRFGIPKEYKYGGVRIRKSELIIGMGLIPAATHSPKTPMSIFDRIRQDNGML